MVIGKRYWINLARNWQKITYPVRPSSVELEIYEEFLKRTLKRKNSPRILVLGATPEMRGLAAGYSNEVTVIDINFGMILAMTELMKKKNPKEIWVRANWVTVPLKYDYYDVILGDGVVNNVSLLEIQAWLKHLKELLKKEGAFLTRIALFLPKEERMEILYKIMDRISKRKQPSYQDYTELNIALEVLTYYSRTKTCPYVNQSRFFKILKNYPLSSKRKKALWQKMMGLFPQTNKAWLFLTEKEAEKLISSIFKIVDRRYDTKAVFSNTFPVYYLIKK